MLHFMHAGNFAGINAKARIFLLVDLPEFFSDLWSRGRKK